MKRIIEEEQDHSEDIESHEKIEKNLGKSEKLALSAIPDANNEKNNKTINQIYQTHKKS